MYAQYFPWSYLDKKQITIFYKEQFNVKAASKVLNSPINIVCKEHSVISFIEQRLSGLEYKYDMSKSIHEQRISVSYKNTFITPKIRLDILLYIGSNAIKQYSINALLLLQKKANKHFSETAQYRVISLDLSLMGDAKCTILNTKTKQSITISRRKLLADYTSWEELFAYSNGIRTEFLKARRAKDSNKRILERINKKMLLLDIPGISFREDFFTKSNFYKAYYNDKPIKVPKGIFAQFKETASSTSPKVLENRSYLERLIISQLRYNSIKPVLYTDSQYAALVQQRTNGKFKPYNDYYPSKLHNDLDVKLVCAKCGTIVKLRHGLCMKDLKCPKCDKAQSKNYSKSAIKWLNDIAERFNITDIEHAENGKEHCIQLDARTRHFVDGFSKKYNLVFEYFGSRWHGNPTMFYMNDAVSPYDSSITAYEYLYRTMTIEKKILDLGYNYIRIWDIDFLDSKRYNQWLVDNKQRLEDILK